MRSVFPVFVFVMVAALLSGCYSNPSPYAGGYNNHAYYKSTPGPQADDLGYDYTPSVNDGILKDYERAAADLILLLEQQNAGLPTDLKFLQTKSNHVPTTTMDYALRQELIVRGYNVYDAKDSGLPEFSFALDRKSNDTNEPLAEGMDLYFVTLSLTTSPETISQVGDPYVLPSYDD